MNGTIAENLQQLGIGDEQLIFVNGQMENHLLKAFYDSLPEFEVFEPVIDERAGSVKRTEKAEVTVFQGKCHVDKHLSYNGEMPEYISPIQVGAALTDKVIADLRDDMRDNISEKNRNYCELTATYYARKNCSAQYKGLCHYRRIFDVTNEQLNNFLIENKEVDVILPYPSIHYPDITAQHTFCVNENSWSAMLQAILEKAPNYYNVFLEQILKERVFYNFNMLIAKKEVFDDYCSFLFSVLERVEELTTPKGWERADRFAGYIGENLTMLYFRKNRDKLNIVHAGRLWLT